jgi:hypothetical protein
MPKLAKIAPKPAVNIWYFLEVKSFFTGPQARKGPTVKISRGIARPRCSGGHAPGALPPKQDSGNQLS